LFACGLDSIQKKFDSAVNAVVAAVVAVEVLDETQGQWEGIDTFPGHFFHRYFSRLNQRCWHSGDRSANSKRKRAVYAYTRTTRVMVIYGLVWFGLGSNGSLRQVNSSARLLGGNEITTSTNKTRRYEQLGVGYFGGSFRSPFALIAAFVCTVIFDVCRPC